MSPRRAAVVAAWLCVLAAAGCIAARARYVTDLSAFLPSHPTEAQRLLVEQLRDGPASRLLLIAIEGGDAATRASLCAALGRRLRADREFSSVGNGAQISAGRDREFLFAHRYLLSDAVSAQRFTVAGLEAAMRETVADLASPEGLLLKSLVPHDPTGEMLHIVEELSRIPAPQTRDGVWVSPDAERALLIAQIAAPGSDTDAQQHAIEAVRTSFGAVLREAGRTARTVELRIAGPGVFAVASRASIERAVVRLSIASGALIVMILLALYRSLPALLLGLLPVATGALIGVAAVALGFGAVHGITLGFGVTLIGEAVDYSIYFFIQSARSSWKERLWPTMRLGMLTSVCGFASLLPSGFPGLAQLGAYSISGLVAAAAVTRCVLPQLLPRGFAIRDLAPLGARIASLLERAGAVRGAARWALALALAGAALAVLVVDRATLWDRELSSLSPIPPAEQRSYALLRADLGAPDALELVIVSGPSLEAVLEGAERTARALAPLIESKVIGGVDSPADYLPSLATQRARRASLPAAEVLRANLDRAAAALGLDAAQLAPFLADVQAARTAPLLEPQDLAGTSLAAGFGALVMHEGRTWRALMPLRAAHPGARARIDPAPIRAALSSLAGAAQLSVHLLDLKRESDALYEDYLHEAMRFSLAGLLGIVVLLCVALRSVARSARVLAPLVLAVLTVAAALALCRIELTLLHLVGMLLIVAVGSNYALFFDRRGPDRRGAGHGDLEQRAGAGRETALTFASLAVANLCTVIGFGLLSFSGVPVLVALGTTVAPGAFLALLFAALLAAGA